mmetsp:Transcript_8386/g.24179  ORF Transcript_8386/g.24179 Transcript_8386/m.24179 type:complete len:105 (-) Transcript_8386:271-585(-)
MKAVVGPVLKVECMHTVESPVTRYRDQAKNLLLALRKESSSRNSIGQGRSRGSVVDADGTRSLHYFKQTNEDIDGYWNLLLSGWSKRVRHFSTTTTLFPSFLAM